MNKIDLSSLPPPSTLSVDKTICDKAIWGTTVRDITMVAVLQVDQPAEFPFCMVQLSSHLSEPGYQPFFVITVHKPGFSYDHSILTDGNIYWALSQTTRHGRHKIKLSSGQQFNAECIVRTPDVGIAVINKNDIEKAISSFINGSLND